MSDFTMKGPDLARLLNALKAADARTSREVRRAIRDAGKLAMEESKREVLKPPPNDRPGSVGTRAAIASGMTTKVMTGKGAQGVRIAASSKNLPANRKRMLRLYNKEKGWRHPVFARDSSGRLAIRTTRAGGIRGLLGARERVWVHQQGRPYFGSVIEKKRPEIERMVADAVDTANEALMRAAFTNRW